MGYGDRREFVDAVAVEAICENLNISGQPDPDLVIRTSGEQRLSGHRGPTGGVSRRRLLRALRDYSTPHASIPYVPPPYRSDGIHASRLAVESVFDALAGRVEL